KVSPPAASITRFDLDSVLWQSAIRRGVDARENCVVLSAERKDHFVVRTKSEAFESKSIVNATGRWSNLTSPAIRFCAADERWIGVKAHFREQHSYRSVDLYFFDGGYCGVQPVSSLTNGHGALVNACAMVRADIATSLVAVLSANPALRIRSQDWMS